MNTTTNQPYNIVCFGEILWDVLPDGAQPGGAPMNVAYHLKQLGQRPAMISRIGKDDWGKKMQQVLADKNILQDYVQIDESLPTGTVDAVPNEHHEMQYVFATPCAWDAIALENNAEKVVSNADYFVFGSLVNRMERSKNTLLSLLKTAKTKVLDINLRPPFFTQPLVEELLCHADILKMNENELALISGWYGTYSTAEEQVYAIQQKHPLQKIIVTMGADGAMVFSDGKFYRNKGFKVEVADTIGSGDSFLAAFLSKTIDGATVEDALQYACAVGALVASKVGGCPAYSLTEVEELKNS